MSLDNQNVILVAYLLAPGEEYAEKFVRWLESYSEHRPGLTHDLLIVCKDGCLAPPITIHNHARQLRFETHPNEGWDIGSLLQVCADHADYPQVAWFGSSCRILHDGYLALMYEWSRRPETGAVAVTGSWEAGISRQTPNPHLRTSCLMVKPRVVNTLGFGSMDTKIDRYEFEHGERSLYRRLQEKKLEGIVVGANGVGFRSDIWSASWTYRRGDQHNLLVADAQTDAFTDASPTEREALALMAGWHPE